MPNYLNAGGKSGVASYEEADDSIEVRFKDGARYLYTSQSVGEGNLETMKSLARAGRGLHSFINKRVKRLYARRL